MGHIFMRLCAVVTTLLVLGIGLRVFAAEPVVKVNGAQHTIRTLSGGPAHEFRTVAGKRAVFRGVQKSIQNLRAVVSDSLRTEIHRPTNTVAPSKLTGMARDLYYEMLFAIDELAEVGEVLRSNGIVGLSQRRLDEATNKIYAHAQSIWRIADGMDRAASSGAPRPQIEALSADLEKVLYELSPTPGRFEILSAGEHLPVFSEFSDKPTSGSDLINTCRETPGQYLETLYDESDLGEDSQTARSGDIAALVEKYNGDPARLFRYVAEGISAEFYYGAMKGAQGTLTEMSGNDIDLASLVITLFRASGYPSRYLRGVARLTVDQALNYTQATNVDAALNLLGTAGMPVRAIRDPNNQAITHLDIERVWVGALVPSVNYRGMGINTAGRQWVILDPHYRKYSQTPPRVGEQTAESYLDEAMIVQEWMNTTAVPTFSHDLTVTADRQRIFEAS